MENSKIVAAANVTQRENPATQNPGIGDVVKNSIMNLLTPTTVNTGETNDPRFMYKQLADLLLDYKSSALQGGDIFGTTEELNIDNISARDGVYEPFLMERLFMVHAPYKLEVQPRIFSFDSNGNATFGVNVATSVSLSALNLATPGLVGWAFRLKANSTLSGDSTMTIQKAATNFSATVSLDVIDQMGTCAVLNHDIDDLKTVAMTVGNFAAGVQTLNYAEVISNVQNQLFFSYSEVSDWTITGRNAVVYAYPIVVSREVNALIYACLFNKEMDKLPVLLAGMYN